MSKTRLTVGGHSVWCLCSTVTERMLLAKTPSATNLPKWQRDGEKTMWTDCIDRARLFATREKAEAYADTLGHLVNLLRAAELHVTVAVMPHYRRLPRGGGGTSPVTVDTTNNGSTT